MADKHLPDLTAGSAVQGADIFLTRQTGATVDKKVTATQLRTYMGAQKSVDVPILLRAGATETWTAMPAAETFLLGVSRTIKDFDATNYTQVRLSINLQTVGDTGAIIYAKYKTVASGYSGTVGSYSDLIPSASGVTIGATTGPRVSSWIDIPAGALNADLILAVVGVLGNGVATPAFSHVSLQFR